MIFLNGKAKPSPAQADQHTSIQIGNRQRDPARGLPCSLIGCGRYDQATIEGEEPFE
jgi:hypothetical protein